MADTPPAAAPADGGGGAEQKKKKVKPPPPPPPAAVMTASAVIRGSLAAVIGQKLGGTCTAVMPIKSITLEKLEQMEAQVAKMQIPPSTAQNL